MKSLQKQIINLNQTAVGLFWLGNFFLNKIKKQIIKKKMIFKKKNEKFAFANKRFLYIYTIYRIT